MSRDTSVGRSVFSYLTKTLLSAALTIVIFLPGISQGQGVVSPVLAEKVKGLMPMRGMSYTPKPSDDTPQPPPKYFDSDFTNGDFIGLYGWGTDCGDCRGDLKVMRDSLNINFLHLYDWSVPPAPGWPVGHYQRDHMAFLNRCLELEIKITVPISNYFLGLVRDNNPEAKGHIQAIVAEILQDWKIPHRAAGMWCIGNEYMVSGFSADVVATVAQYIIEKEEALGITDKASQLPIIAPVTFGMLKGKPPAVYQIQELERAFKANSFLAKRKVWEERFIAAIQTFNDGPFLSNYIKDTFPRNFPGMPFFFSELGVGITGSVKTEKEQAEWLAGQLKAAAATSGNFIGSCVFQFMNQFTKAPPEDTFGIQKFAGPPTNYGTIPVTYVPGGGEKYPVDPLAEKPSYTIVRNAYKP